VTHPHEPDPDRHAAGPGAATGHFIALEGGDGAGKSTQAALLGDWLESLGRTVLLTHEPGGTPVGQAIRQVLLHGEHVTPRAEALLFAADRGHHVETVIRPALARGVVVVTDRYMDSSIAYQGAGRDLAAEDVEHLSRWATQELLPDLTVVLDVSPDVGRARRGQVHDRLESEPDDFHAAVRRRFLDLAAREPARYLAVDAGRPADDIQLDIRRRVTALLDQGALS
jgi:dTMP kinase